MKKQDPGAYDMGSGKPVEKEEQTRCQGSLWIECQVGTANRCGLVIFQYDRKLAQQMAKMSEEQRAELVRARKAVALQVFLNSSRKRVK